MSVFQLIVLISNKGKAEIAYFFIVGRMATFEICIGLSKLRPTHEYISQPEIYSEASGDTLI